MRRYLRSNIWWVLGGLACTLAAAEARAQRVEFRPGSGGLPAANAALRRVLERDRYQVLTRDTVLGPDVVVVGDLILLQASLRVEGQVRGDLIAVQSDVFARPGGRLEGEVAVLGGGFYGSSLASLRAPPIDASRVAYEVSEEAGPVYLVSAPGARARLRLLGLYGLTAPGYDRVNALSLGWGLAFDRGATALLPNAEARVRIRSVREVIDGELRVRWPLGAAAFSLHGGRTVRSNDTWATGALENSLYSLIAAQDGRNHYEADFAEARLRLTGGSALRWWAGFELGWERSRSLRNRDPFSILSARGGFRDNLPVDEADVADAALLAGVRRWLGDRGWLDLELRVERADADVAGDLTYTLVGARFAASLATVAGQRLIVQGRGQVPGAGGAPRQRWQALGGWGSLPTLRPVAREGDRLWWLAATYRLPLRSRSDLLGRLVAWAQYAAGNAWDAGTGRRSEVHNLGVGLTFGVLAASVYADLGRDFRTVLAAGIDLRR